jgi:hypothetical protein
MKNTPVRINLADPGPMPTRLRGLAFPGEPDNTHPDPAIHVPAFLELASPECARHGERLILRQT